jgi:uncharacterized protein YndB with AHSA1/START domain
MALLVSGGTVVATGAAANANPASFSIAQTDSTTPQSEPAPSDARFGCEVVGGQYTVMYYPQSQPGQSYAWATPTELGGGWTEDRRCNEISRRLESYRPDGLVEMRTSVENGYDIVCVTTEAVPACRIVLTVPPGQDPLATRDRVFGNLVTADSGERTQGVVTYSEGSGRDILGQIGDAVGIDLSDIMGNNRRSANQSSYRSNGIDLRPFLDPADGGTGERL